LSNSTQRLLHVETLVTGYRKKTVLNGTTLCVIQGEIVALIGHNGAGKSTLLKTVFGLLPIWEGQVIIDGSPFNSLNPRELLHAGISYVPQGNRVFTNLSVQDNLEIGGTILSSKSQLNSEIERVLTLFPALKPHLRQPAGTLSGGQKQILALAIALLLSPRLLLLDEPSSGLAPAFVARLFSHIQQLCANSGTAVLLVEQKVREVLKIAHRVYILNNGAVSFSGHAHELNDEDRLREAFFKN
jgi:branched-chain amino acid transport system ATP-binding protein